MIAGVVSYMLLCWGVGGGFVGLVSLTSSPYSSEHCSRREVGLPPGFCYVCVCVGLRTRTES